jgi:hypothetical protein
MKKVILFLILLFPLNIMCKIIQTLEAERIIHECSSAQMRTLERGMNEIAQSNKPTEANLKIATLIDKAQKEFEQCVTKKVDEKCIGDGGELFIGVTSGMGILAGIVLIVVAIIPKN